MYSLGLPQKIGAGSTWDGAGGGGGLEHPTVRTTHNLRSIRQKTVALEVEEAPWRVGLGSRPQLASGAKSLVCGRGLCP